ncbi:MAG: hypothetical protein IJ868_05810 [Prevotella sp.]|nr:hypothetical protein [Prevotella sp.]
MALPFALGAQAQTTEAPDRVPHPHYYEVQHVYQPITFVHEGDYICLINRNQFTALDEYDYTYTILQNGDSIASGPLTLSGDRLAIPTLPKDAEHPDGKEMLVAPLEPYFWKPENDNQSKANFAQRLAVWKDAADKRTVRSVTAKKGKNSVTITAEMSLPVGADYTLTYTIKGNGQVKVEADYQPTATDIPLIPKFGMRMRLPANFTNVEYYGRGPWENYPDRKHSAFVGHYKMPLSEFETEYVKPQDNGNRCDVRWLELSNGQRTLRVDGCQPLCIRVWDYGEEDLEDVRHPNDITRGHFVNLNIDENIHGVGGADTWGKRTLPQYTLDGNQPRHYSFNIRIEKR